MSLMLHFCMMRYPLLVACREINEFTDLELRANDLLLNIHHL